MEGTAIRARGVAEGVKGLHDFIGVVEEVDVSAVVPLLVVDIAYDQG